MTKKRCKVKLWIIVALTLIGLFFTFVSFVIPTTNTTFNGFFNAINFGYDVNGGKLAVYDVYNDSLTGYDLDAKLDQTVAKLNSSLGSLGLNVTKQDNQIRVEISSADMVDVETLAKNYGVDVFSSIGAEKGISFNSGDKYDADGSIGGEYIERCTYDYQNQWFVKIEFNEEGKKLFKELTSSIVESDSGTLNMYINGEKYGSGFEIDSAVSVLTLTATNQQSAEALAIQISALAKPITLTQVSNDLISAGLNTSTKGFLGNQTTLISVALALVFGATIALLCVRYKMLGAMATMSLLIFTVLYSFLLQSIPLVLMDVNGIMGVLATYVILVAGIVSVFEKIRSEYALGKKIPNSIRSGFKKNVLPTLEKYVFGLLFCAVLYIVGTVALKAFAVSLFIGLFVNYFVLFVALRGSCVLYMNVNPTNKKAYNLNREAVKHEI